MAKEIDRYNLEAGFVSLEDFEHCSKLGHFMEVVLWRNGEGFDVNLSTNTEQRFQMTWGQFKALKKLIKELDG